MCINFLVAFLLHEKGAREKLAKENAKKEISRSAEREKGVAPSPHKLLKKIDQNFSHLTNVLSTIEGAFHWNAPSAKINKSSA